MNALKVYMKLLRQTRSRFLDDDVRVARAFDAGYALLLDAARTRGVGEPNGHPNASVMKAGSRALGVCASDAKVGLSLIAVMEPGMIGVMEPVLGE